MSNTFVIFKKEMRAYFNSPIAYIFLAVFLGLSGWFFFSTFFFYNQASLRGILDLIPVLFIFFIPAISMRLVAEERKTGTLELLLTYPVTETEVIVGKFLAALSLVTLGVVLTGTYVLTAASLGNLDAGVTFSGYVGMILVGAAYMAIGIYASTLTDNQIVAFIIGIVIAFLFYYLDKVIIFVPDSLAGIFESLSIDFHYRNLLRGVFDLRDIVYYLSVIFFGIVLASGTLSKRKWS